MRTKLLISIAGILPLLLAAAFGWWAGRSSPVIGVVVFAAVLVALLVLLHNFDGVVTRPILARDDQILFHACESGLVSRSRRLYRHLPASPRCRVCLVPFGGVGRLVGIPSKTPLQSGETAHSALRGPAGKPTPS